MLAVSEFRNSYKFCNGLSAIFEAFVWVHFLAIFFVKLRTVETVLSWATQYVGHSRCIREVNKHHLKWMTNAMFYKKLL